MRDFSELNTLLNSANILEILQRHGTLLSDEFYFVMSEDAKFMIDKDHAYYNQIQHQLADEMSFL